MKLNKYFLIISLITAVASNSFAAGPLAFTYQGKLMNAAGTAPLTSTVGLKLDILDPSGNCLIYSETQNNIDLSQTNGLFAVFVGTAVNDSKRTAGADLGLAMTQVFANAGNQLVAPGGTCTSGYTPTSGDGRLLHVSVINGGTTTIISPDLPINSVPNALVAETLQGSQLSQVVVPTGIVSAFVGSSCPTGYVKADGSSLSRSGSNVALAAMLGITTGTNFNIPDMRGLFLRGLDTTGTVDPNGAGRVVLSVQQDQFQGHVHNVLTNTNNTGGSSGGNSAAAGWNGAVWTSTNGYGTTGAVTDGTNGTPRNGIETRPKNMAVNYCIKL